MSYIEIEQTELSDKERAAVTAGGERWSKMAKGMHLDDWLALIEPLQIGRRLALRIAHSNQPVGRLYNEAFSNFRTLHFRGLDTTSVSCLLWLGDESDRLAKLAELRTAMNEAERARLNSPITARQKVEKALKPPAVEGEAAAPKLSAAARIKQLEAELEVERKRLDRGSLVDFEYDSGPQIGKVLASTVSESKWKAIVEAGNAVIAAKHKARSKPAG